MTELKRLSMIFRLKYDRLAAILEDDNTDDLLEISAILRHLLIGDSLAESLGSLFGLPISFPLNDDSDPPLFGKTSEFLKMRIYGYKIEELIDAFANYAGGVHHHSKDQIQTEIVDRLLGCFEKYDGYNSLREILGEGHRGTNSNTRCNKSKCPSIRAKETEPPTDGAWKCNLVQWLSIP